MGKAGNCWGVDTLEQVTPVSTGTQQENWETKGREWGRGLQSIVFAVLFFYPQNSRDCSVRQYASKYTAWTGLQKCQALPTSRQLTIACIKNSTAQLNKNVLTLTRKAIPSLENHTEMILLGCTRSCRFSEVQYPPPWNLLSFPLKLSYWLSYIWYNQLIILDNKATHSTIGPSLERKHSTSHRFVLITQTDPPTVRSQSLALPLQKNEHVPDGFSSRGSAWALTFPADWERTRPHYTHEVLLQSRWQAIHHQTCGGWLP